MAQPKNQIAHAANILVNVAAFAVDPSGVTGGAMAVNGFLSGRELWPDRARKSLAAEIADTLETTLNDPPFHMPKNGPVYLPQMVEMGVPSAEDVTQCGMDVERLLDAMLAKHSYAEHQGMEMQAAFRNLLRPVLSRLLNDARFVETLGPQITRETFARLDRIETKVENVPQQVLDLLQEKGYLPASTPPDGIALRDLVNLAARFEEHDIRDPEALVTFLTNKAEEYRAFKAELVELRETQPQLDNVISQALAELESPEGDIDAVRARIREARETLGSSVLHVAVLKNYSLTLLDAQGALLQGNADEAYTLLSAGADSLAVFEPEAPAVTRVPTSAHLYEHGLRYGGTGLARAADMLRAALVRISKEDNPKLWADAHNRLAVTLEEQGIRTEGEKGTALFAEAIAAYRDALTVYSPEDHPVLWAMTTQNLTDALRKQASRAEGTEATRLFAEAITSFREIIKVVTRDDHSEEWAITTQNLAVALQEQASRTEGPEAADLFGEAVTAYRAALEVYTREGHPVHWAVTTQNLAIALQQQASRTEGPEAARLFAEAVTAYRDALEVRTREDDPLRWAMTTQNLAGALSDQAERTEGPEAARLFAEAVTAFRAALEVRTRADQPFYWAQTQENLALCELSWAGHDTTAAPRPHLDAALAYVDDALEVYDRETLPYDHGTATRLRTDILNALDALEPPA